MVAHDRFGDKMSTFKTSTVQNVNWTKCMKMNFEAFASIF